MKKVIITGATGAVGVALINELLNYNYEIYVICHRESKRVTNIPNHKNIKIFFANLNELNNINLPIDNVDFFYHLAWDGTYGESRNNSFIQMKNIEYSMYSVELAHKLKCKVYIGTGSQSEYGNSNEIKGPLSLCSPNNFYGAAKLSSSYMTRNLCNQYGIKHIWCRIFSLFGPYDGQYTMIMSSINKMLNNKECLFTKGEQVWDYIYSKDAAKALRLVAEKGKNNSIYCIASGQRRLLKEYIYSMHKIVNEKCSIRIGAIPYYEHQAMNLSADISNLIEDTDFKASYSFEDGIQDLLKEMKSEYK